MYDVFRQSYIRTTSDDVVYDSVQPYANDMQIRGKMAADDVADVVLSAAVFFEIFGTKDTDSDEDVKEPLLDDAVNGRVAAEFTLYRLST